MTGIMNMNGVWITNFHRAKDPHFIPNPTQRNSDPHQSKLLGKVTYTVTDQGTVKLAMGNLFYHPSQDSFELKDRQILFTFS